MRDQAEPEFDDIVNRALANEEQVDRGQIQLAARRCARRRRKRSARTRRRYGEHALNHSRRDIALATYDGDAAAEAIVELARAIHIPNAAKIAEFLSSEAQALYEYGRDRGSNVHLVAAIALRREQLALAGSADERGVALNNLGNAVLGLGWRESGTG